jgi:hypothetical protein
MFFWSKLQRPGYATAQEWKKWNRITQSKYPLTYLLSETLSQWISLQTRNISAPFKKIYNFFYYRFYEKNHLVQTSLKPNYYDADLRMLHANFQLLVDFVEIECAAGCRESHQKPSLVKRLTQGLNAWRNPELGLKYLDPHAIDENEPGVDQIKRQNQSNAELKRLYIWWTQERPARVDPYDTEKWTNFHSGHTGQDVWDWVEPNNKQTRQQLNDAVAESIKLEDHYNREDQENLEKLIKLRKYLWS